MKLFLDDEREPTKYECGSDNDPAGFTVVRTAEEAIELIRQNVVTFICFDHDLGTELTGYDVAKEIERLAAEGKIGPIDYRIHSGNTVGGRNIDKAMKSAWRCWHEEDKGNTFDSFLQDATLTVHDLWTEIGGAELTTHELRALNEILTTFFADKRESTI